MAGSYRTGDTFRHYQALGQLTVDSQEPLQTAETTDQYPLGWNPSGASQETSQEQEASQEQTDHQIDQRVENSGRQGRKRKSRQFSYEETTCLINLWSHSRIQNLLTRPTAEGPSRTRPDTGKGTVANSSARNRET